MGHTVGQMRPHRVSHGTLHGPSHEMSDIPWDGLQDSPILVRGRVWGRVWVGLALVLELGKMLGPLWDY